MSSEFVIFKGWSSDGDALFVKKMRTYGPTCFSKSNLFKNLASPCQWPQKQNKNGKGASKFKKSNTEKSVLLGKNFPVFSVNIKMM